MGDEPGKNIQQQDLVNDDVADAISSAVNDELTKAEPNKAVPDITKPEPVAPILPSINDPSLPSPTVPEEPAATDELHDIKQQAIQQLGPMVEHINQEPQERFDTLMMMIRASDDRTLVKPAYEAAQKITDDKKKTQALLDIVNEVNYLTRPDNTQDSKD